MNGAIFHPASIASAGQCLHDAASKALALLELTGHPPRKGNTTEDLRIANANYEQATKQFVVTVKSAAGKTQFRTTAASSLNAFMQAAESQGDTLCAISVTPEKTDHKMQDRAALERAHRALRTSMPLDEMLKQPALAKTLAIVAFQKPRKERARFDWRKAQANDLD